MNLTEKELLYLLDTLDKRLTICMNNYEIKAYKNEYSIAEVVYDKLSSKYQKMKGIE